MLRDNKNKNNVEVTPVIGLVPGTFYRIVPNVEFSYGMSTEHIVCCETLTMCYGVIMLFFNGCGIPLALLYRSSKIAIAR